MIALLDSDIIAYRISFACKDDDLATALSTLDVYIADILLLGVPEVTDFKLFLTGKGNFRKEVAVTAEYKGNRKDIEKPHHLEAIRSFLIEHWGATVSIGQEADDDIAIAATTIGEEGCVIVSLDKDLDQISGHHYNFVKKTKYYVDKPTAVLNFYKQILTGDTADNIVGIKGIGPAKAAKLLADCTDEKELYQACVDAYEGDINRVHENAQLLYLLRKENEKWTKPL
jgi:5'-3' exonuclease